MKNISQHQTWQCLDFHCLTVEKTQFYCSVWVERLDIAIYIKYYGNVTLSVMLC